MHQDILFKVVGGAEQRYARIHLDYRLRLAIRMAATSLTVCRLPSLTIHHVPIEWIRSNGEVVGGFDDEGVVVYQNDFRIHACDPKTRDLALNNA